MDSMPVLNQPVPRSGALLEQVTRRIRLRSESVLAHFDLRPRHLVALTVLRDRSGSTQRALATTLEMDGTNVVGLLNDLETAGLIERKRSPQDRRRHIVELTDEGIKRLAKAEFALATVEDEVFGTLSAAERETMYTLLQRTVNGDFAAPGTPST
jgi:DNA-binding MarR family transcriptional regulator